MALGAHRVRSGDAGIGIGKKIGDESAGHCSLAELVIALEDVRVDRAVRAVRAGAAEFAIVVAVVAIGAEDLRSDQIALRPSPFGSTCCSRLGCGSGLVRA